MCLLVACHLKIGGNLWKRTKCRKVTSHICKKLMPKYLEKHIYRTTYGEHIKKIMLGFPELLNADVNDLHSYKWSTSCPWLFPLLISDIKLISIFSVFSISVYIMDKRKSLFLILAIIISSFIIIINKTAWDNILAIEKWEFLEFTH